METKRIFKLSRAQWISVAVLASSVGLAAAVTIPNSFTAATTISASQMNANFTALGTAVTAAESNIGNLQTGLAAKQDRVGGTCPAGESIRAIAADGSVTCDSGGGKFINLNTFGAFLANGAAFSTGFGPNAGMALPDAGTPHFSMGFIVPPDYTPGTNMTVRFIWHSSAVSCGIVFRGNYIAVARAGRTHIIGGATDTGLTLVGGTTLNAPATANQSNAKDMTISTPVPGTNLQAGDSIIFGVFRAAADAADTCAANLMIQGMSVSYL